MFRSARIVRGLVAALVLALGLAATSCGGSGVGSDANVPLVLVSFNLPDIGGVALNQPLIFTFSTAVDKSSISPDTLRVVGPTGGKDPIFDPPVVDGNLVGLIPRTPNRFDYTDAGMRANTKYSVGLPVFPAPSTIRSASGHPLLQAASFSYTTVPTSQFIEPRRPLIHDLPPPAGRGEDTGCLQNVKHDSLYTAQTQSGSGPGARLLCLINEGKPMVVEEECNPRHAAQGVGNPSSVKPGYIDLPALRVKTNEPVDPFPVSLINSKGIGVNVQLWRVGDTNKLRLPAGPEQVATNQPITVQSTDSQEIILVAQKEVLQGTYLVNLIPDTAGRVPAGLRDMTQQPLETSNNPDPVANGGYGDITGAATFLRVPPGFRLWFTTLAIPSTPQAIIENFANNLNEWGDVASLTTEPGVFTKSVVTTNPNDFILGGAVPPQPSLTLVTLAPRTSSSVPPGSSVQTSIGQSTTANWHNDFRFMNLSNLDVNNEVDDGTGRLKAVWKPWAGTGVDGVMDTDVAPNGGPGPGDNKALTTDAVSGASLDNDGIYEFERVHIRPGDVVSANGSNPLVILCRGDFIVEGTLLLNGADGNPGLDTDDSLFYVNPGSFPAFGAGGLAGPGAGKGGDGADPFGTLNAGGTGTPGRLGRRIEGNASTNATSGGPIDPTNPNRDFEQVAGNGGGAGTFGDTAAPSNNKGGGGGGMGANGNPGADASAVPATNGGLLQSDAVFSRDLADFVPDRGYMPNTNAYGGSGGGGGGADDDNGATQAGNGGVGQGDDGGGGGGGGGGCMIVFVGGVTTVTATGLVQANGGRGGNTLNRANTLVGLGPDGNPGTSDDFNAGPNPAGIPSGEGAPGGGGSGGAILLFSKGNVTLNGAVQARGAAGGQSGDLDRIGGTGSGGRLAVGLFPGSTVSPAAPPLIDVSPSGTAFAFSWNPTVHLDSSGQSEWFDLAVVTAQFGNIDPDGAGPTPPTNQPPFFTTNFPSLTGMVKGVDFDAWLEFQGATDLPGFIPGGSPPVSATGLSQWNANPDSIDSKRYIRYRWLFFVKDAFPGTGPSGLAMPAITDVTIPFLR